jgi:thiamine biosynthesis lipoprotein
LGVAILAGGYWYTSREFSREPAKGSLRVERADRSGEGLADTPGLPDPWVHEGGRATLAGPIMGTSFSVTVRGLEGSKAGEIAGAVLEALERVDGLMSSYKPDSELSRFNRAGVEGVEVSKEVIEVLKISRRIYRSSKEAFDPTVGPLVRAWGFGPDKAPETEPANLEALRALVGFDRIRWKWVEGGKAQLSKEDSAMEVDLSAVAKGYASDRVCGALQEAGLKDYMVEVGGEICVAGVGGPGQPWRVGVERPAAGRAGLQRAIALGPELQPVGMATSGDYRNYREIDGKRVSHTIDPRTGRPVEHSLASVTVLAPTSAEADAWATALSVLGPDEGLELATKSGVAAYFIVRQREGFAEHDTPAFATLVEPSWAPDTPPAPKDTP